MAINPSTEFVGKIDNSDPTGYPLGKARNVTAPGDGTGTPFVANLLNDLFGFQQALLTQAALTASGTPDAANASQYLEALQKLSGKQVFKADGTFNTPAWVSRIKVTVVGAGGGGGGASTGGSTSGGGGGAGGYGVLHIVDPAASYTVTIGQGGAGGAGGVDGAQGTVGGTTSFGAVLAMSGGGGASQTSGATGALGQGGFGGGEFTTNPDAVTTFGGDGQSGLENAFSPGPGGYSPFGGRGGIGGAPGVSNNPTDGTAGQDGIVIVEWGIGV